MERADSLCRSVFKAPFFIHDLAESRNPLAVPGILNPVVLMQKYPDGSLAPWNWGSKFKDGSLRVDIPVQALNLYFNVTHPVVSQVNPHVHLFFFAPRGYAGKPVAHRKGKGSDKSFVRYY